MSWFFSNIGSVASYTWWHLLQAIPAIVLTLVIGVAVAKIVSGSRIASAATSAASGLMYAIPSLPLFIVLPIIFGTALRSPVNTGIALTLYGLAIMMPGAIAALTSIDRAVLQAATAQGFTPTGRFFSVELPLAGPALIATLRVVAVSTVALVTVGGVLGVPSLGMLFTDGIKRGLVAEIFTGIFLTVLIALLIDAAIVVAARALMPWNRKAVKR